MTYNNSLPSDLEEYATDIAYRCTLTEFLKDANKLLLENRGDALAILGEIIDTINFQGIEDLTDVPVVPYAIMENDNAVRLYLRHTDFCTTKDKEFAQDNFENLLSMTEETQKCNSSNHVLITKIQQVMDSLSTCSDFLKVLPKSHTIIIALLDCPKTRYCGALPDSYSLVSGRVYHPIMVSNFVGAEENTMQSFMRALGYIYLFALTGSFNQVPSNFTRLQRGLEKDQSKIKVGGNLGDMFAEYFVLALCLAPELRQYDPYPDASLAIKNIIRDYMWNTAKHNPMKNVIDISGTFKS